MTSKDTVSKAVATYIRIRDAIQIEEAAHQEAIAGLKDQLKVVSDFLLTKLSDVDAQSLKTEMGTVSRRVKSRYWTSDWEHFYAFIQENNAPHLLERRIHNGNMKQFLEDHPDQFPIGLHNDREYVIQVRKPTAK